VETKVTTQAVAPSKSATPAPVAQKAPVHSGPIRVLCVDDSPTILALLKQILASKFGFEVVGTAMNGLEAAAKVKELNPDVMTLDIHMPEQTGIEYLEKNFNSKHPPVMMITSVSRDDSAMAGKALSLGAGDYVEKPALTNIAERGDEIRAKLKCLFQYRTVKTDHLAFDQQFLIDKKLKTADGKIRVVIATLSHRESLKKLVRELSGTQPPMVILSDGAKAVLPTIAEALAKDFGRKVHYSDTPSGEFKPGEIYLLDLNSQIDPVLGFAKGKQVSIMVYGEHAQKSSEKLLKFENAHLMLEDLGGGKGAQFLNDVASEIVLPTSFAYISNEWFIERDEKKSA
jgi:chemotaxis protein methyltransferase CheR